MTTKLLIEYDEVSDKLIISAVSVTHAHWIKHLLPISEVTKHANIQAAYMDRLREWAERVREKE